MHNILLVGNYSNDTGYAWNNIYRLFDRLAEHVLEKGVKAYASFPDIRKNYTPFRHISKNFLHFDPCSYSFPNLLGLAEFIRSKNIGLVYFTDQNTFKFLYLFLKLVGVKAILVHCRVSVPDPNSATASIGPKKQIKYLLNRLPLITADYTFCVSQFVYDRLDRKNQYPKKKLIKVINGIDTEKFSPLVSGENKEKRRLNIFISGRATPHKGIDILIRAIALVVQKNIKSFIVDYAGDGPCYNEYVRLAAELGVSKYIQFHGQVSTTHTLLQQSDIVCVPSSWGDACPSAVSEALSCGKPLISTFAGGIPEMVGSPDNAVMIKPGDTEALAENIEMLLCNPELRVRYGTRARARAQEALSQERYYMEMTGYFDKIMSSVF